MSFSQSLLPEFEEEMKNTRKILECVPDGKFDYQPHPKSMKLGRLATHIAELPGWGMTTLTTTVLEMDSSNWKPNIASTQAELLEMFDKNVAAAREKITAASDEEWQVNWSLKFDGTVVIRSASRFSSDSGTAVSAWSVQRRFRNGDQSTAYLLL